MEKHDGLAAARPSEKASFASLFRPPYGRHTLTLLLINFFGMSAGGDCLPGCRRISLAGGAGRPWVRDCQTTTLLVILNLSACFRRRQLRRGWLTSLAQDIFHYLYVRGGASSAALCFGEESGGDHGQRNSGRLLRHGFLSGSGIVASEIFPTQVRARALGLTYNGVRTTKSIAPTVIGYVGQTKGLSWALTCARFSVDRFYVGAVSAGNAEVRAWNSF